MGGPNPEDMPGESEAYAQPCGAGRQLYADNPTVAVRGLISERNVPVA